MAECAENSGDQAGKPAIHWLKSQNPDINVRSTVLSKADSLDRYGHRCEIEHGFRKMAPYLLQKELTLRSKKPELFRRLLWSVVVANNMLRFMKSKTA